MAPILKTQEHLERHVMTGSVGYPGCITERFHQIEVDFGAASVRPSGNVIRTFHQKRIKLELGNFAKVSPLKNKTNKNKRENRVVTNENKIHVHE